MTRWRALRRFGPVAAIAVITAMVLASGFWRELSWSHLAACRAWLKSLAAAHFGLGLALFGLAVTLVVIACLPGMSALGLLAGVLFGAWIGGAATLVACVVGSVLLFLACRTAFGGWARRRGAKWVRNIAESFSEHPFTTLLALKLFPAVPYFVPNVAAALAAAPLWAVAAATAVGSAPLCFLLAAMGAGAGGALGSGAPLTARLVLGPRLLLPLAGLGLLALAPVAWRAARRNRR
ncbi:MAG TPA: VTT domain-containing protein [Caulobacteraceae bacterium]|nr:VTT domain-containing protein [Caulobacteraceae bacterium]